jgi:DNA-binding CsgD family transcriptional regulator
VIKSSWGDVLESISKKNTKLIEKKHGTRYKIFISCEEKAYLTPREFELVKYILQGYTYKKIAKFVGISPRTVEDHMKNLKSKVRCKTKKQLRYFLTIKQIEVESAV